MSNYFEKTKELTKFIETTWHKPMGLAIALILTFFLIITTPFFSTFLVHESITSTIVKILVVVLFFASIIVLWFWQHILEKTKTDRIGFVVSISCESDEASSKLREDFLIPLRRRITSGKMGEKIQFIELSQLKADKVIDRNHAVKLSVDTRAHFVLYGRVRKRIINGVENHVIDLDGIVTHAPIPKSTGDVFSNEFGEVFPKQLLISGESDFLAFQFTSEWTDILVKYVLGIAISFSGDLTSAEDLYSDALESLSTKDKNFPIYAILRQKLPFRISELYEIRAFQAYKEWIKSHKPDAIDNLDTHLQKVADSRKNNTEILNLSAICYFLKNREAQGAISLLKKIRKNTMDILDYNLGFLYCYKGDLKVATRHYKKAVLTEIQTSVILEMEDFMRWILENESEKYQIYYALGFLNWKAKGDCLQASEDFNNFLKLYDNNPAFEKAISLTNDWIAEIRKTT